MEKQSLDLVDFYNCAIYHPCLENLVRVEKLVISGSDTDNIGDALFDYFGPAKESIPKSWHTSLPQVGCLAVLTPEAIAWIGKSKVQSMIDSFYDQTMCDIAPKFAVVIKKIINPHTCSSMSFIFKAAYLCCEELADGVRRPEMRSTEDRIVDGHVTTFYKLHSTPPPLTLDWKLEINCMLTPARPTETKDLFATFFGEKRPVKKRELSRFSKILLNKRKES